MNTFFTVLAALFVYETIFVLIRIGLALAAVVRNKEGNLK